MNKRSAKNISSRMRLTNQRQAILNQFKGRKIHLTADEVYHLVRRKLPKVSLGTVYRNLELLSEQGLIQKHEISGQQKVFDSNIDDHYHLHCLNCGGLEDIEISSVKIDFSKLKKESNIKITGQSLELTGLCSKCVNDSRREV